MKRIYSYVIASLLAGCTTAGSPPAGDAMLYGARTLPAADYATKNLRVTFIGVATLLFDDGETAIMTDGYFTRAPREALTNVAPDRDRITRALARAGVKSLAAVIPVHSHFDHALDSPIVAQQTGALLVGSTSTANIGRGYGLPENRIRVPRDGETLKFGRFNVTFLKSAHLPNNFAMGEIEAPLAPPAKATDYKVGEAYTLLVEHDGRTILIQGSAGFIPGALNGSKADVAYLGIGGLNTQDDKYREGYWHEIVRAVGARRVVPIHWDNFFVTLDEDLKPGTGLDQSMRFVLASGRRDGVDIRMPVAWQAADPFAGMK
ncbi:MAG: MBL fold metallo-hydrolase [Sulfurifustis sp.]